MAMQQWRLHMNTKHRSTTMCGSPTHFAFTRLQPVSWQCYRAATSNAKVRRLWTRTHAPKVLSHTAIL